MRSAASANRPRNLALVSTLARTEFLTQRFPPNLRARESSRSRVEVGVEIAVPRRSRPNAAPA